MTRRRFAIALICLVSAVTLVVPTVSSAGLLTGLLGGSGTTGSILYVVDDLVDNLLTGRTALSASDCTDPVVSKAFADVGDQADYFLVPGGDFADAAAGWQMNNGAISASRLWLTGSFAAAVSPKICVGDEEPTMRFRYASSGYSPRLRIDALFRGTGGELRSDYVDTITGARSYGASSVIRLGTNARAAAGAKTAIALVFTVERGNWEIDDVYVDPFRSR